MKKIIIIGCLLILSMIDIYGQEKVGFGSTTTGPGRASSLMTPPNKTRSSGMFTEVDPYLSVTKRFSIPSDITETLVATGTTPIMLNTFTKKLSYYDLSGDWITLGGASLQEVIDINSSATSDNFMVSNGNGGITLLDDAIYFNKLGNGYNLTDASHLYYGNNFNVNTTAINFNGTSIFNAPAQFQTPVTFKNLTEYHYNGTKIGQLRAGPNFIFTEIGNSGTSIELSKQLFRTINNYGLLESSSSGTKLQNLASGYLDITNSGISLIDYNKGSLNISETSVVLDNYGAGKLEINDGFNVKLDAYSNGNLSFNDDAVLLTSNHNTISLDGAGNNVSINTGNGVVNFNPTIGIESTVDFSEVITTNSYTQKSYIDSRLKNISEISFKTRDVYGTFASPMTGNITTDLTDGVLGIVQKMYHEDTTLPTFPVEFVNINPDSDYNINGKNIIYFEYSEGPRVEYWIINL